VPPPPAPESVALGDFEIRRVNRALYWWDGGALFGVVPKTLWSRRIPADDLNRIPLAFNCYLIRTGEHSILIETGLGDKRDPRERERMRIPEVTESLPSALAAQGIDTESIDIVINSHLHWDHCSGNTIIQDGHAAPAFPRARYYASRGEWEHAHERNVRDAVSYIDDNYDPLVDSGRMILVDRDHQVVPGVWMRTAPGHNRDMMIVTAESRGRTFCFFSDLVPTAAHVQPTWVASFDLYPLETIASKNRWLAEAAGGQWLCAFGHDTALPFARIAADPKKQWAVVS
jgi:glyoxylase-like metal-dependent hydrolase (beta-lactamase superfamily II)